MTEVSIQPVEDRTALLERYRAHHAQTHSKSFFQSPAWTETWLHTAPSESKIYLVTSEKSQARLLGLFGMMTRRPLQLHETQLRLAEWGKARYDAIYTEYNDFLIAGDCDEDRAIKLRKEAIKALLQRFSNIDSLVFRNAKASLMKAAQAVCASGVTRLRLLRELPVHRIDLTQFRNADFLQSLKSSVRQKLRRAMRAYEERGPLTTSHAKGGKARKRAWRALIDLHQTSWERRGLPGAFSNDHFRAFHESLLRRAPDQTQLLTFSAGDEAFAAFYEFTEDGHVYGYQGGLRYEDDTRLTPGYVAHYLSIKAAIARGDRIYDFLAGDDDYKRRLGAHAETLYSFVIENPTLRNRMKWLIKR